MRQETHLSFGYSILSSFSSVLELYSLRVFFESFARVICLVFFFDYALCLKYLFLLFICHASSIMPYSSNVLFILLAFLSLHSLDISYFLLVFPIDILILPILRLALLLLTGDVLTCFESSRQKSRLNSRSCNI